MSGYPVGRQFSRKGNGGGLQQSSVAAAPIHTFHSPLPHPPAATAATLYSSTPPGQPQRPSQPLPQPSHAPAPVRGVQQPFSSSSTSPASVAAAAAGSSITRPMPQPQLQMHQQQLSGPRQTIVPPAAPASLPSRQPPAARSNPFSPLAPAHTSAQPQLQPYAPAMSGSPPQQLFAPHTPQPLPAAPNQATQPAQSAWQRRAASVSHNPVYTASHGHDAAYGDGSDMAAEEFVQPTSAHRAYTTAAQRRQPPPPPPQPQQQQPYRPPPIQPSQQPSATSALIDSGRKRSLLDDDDDELANLPDELFNLQPAAAIRTTASSAANSAGPAPAVRRPMPANMPAQAVPVAGGHTGQLTPTKRKADDINAETSYAPPPAPQPRPPVPHLTQQPPARRPQPDVQFNAHLNALVTATPARPEMAGIAGVKMEGIDGPMAGMKQEAGEYVRLTKKERAQLVLAKTKAEEKVLEERQKAAEERKRAAEEREKREQAEAALALLRNNLNSLKQETARNAAQSSQQKMAQSQQAEQAKQTLEVNYQTVRVERDALEMQLQERNAQLRRLQQQLQQQQQQQQQQQKGEAPQAPAPLPVTSSPPLSQTSTAVKAQPAAIGTTDESAVVAAVLRSSSPAHTDSSASPSSKVASSASNEALIEAFRNLAPSLLGTEQTEGQRVASQLLTMPLATDSAESNNSSSPLIALVHSLNSYIANQPAAPTHSVSQPLASTSLPASFPSVTHHLSHHIKELESFTMQVRDGTLPPDALLSPACHLLNSLCNISSVPVDLTLFAATQPSGLPRRMKAIDDNIVQLLNIMLVVLRSSPTCRRAAVRGLGTTAAAQGTVAVIAPAVYQHPLYAYRPPKTSPMQRQLSNRAAGSSGDSEKDREASEQRLKERAEQQHKQRADTSPSASTLPLSYPDPILLLLNILQTFQRINPRAQADLFLQPALSCLLLLVDEAVAARVSPAAVGFGGLLDERRLLPLLCWAPAGTQHVSLAVRCVAVQLFGLLVVDRDALRLVAYRPQANGPSLLQCLYSCLLTDSDRDKSLMDVRQKEARSRQHANHRLTAREDESGDKGLSVDKWHEVILCTRLHVVRFMAFVVERYGADGVQWLSNEREREERKESMEADTVVLDGDEHHILTLLVRLMTAEMQQIAAYQRQDEPLHILHSSQPASAALFRDRRPDLLYALSQPAPLPLSAQHDRQAPSKAARSLLHSMRVDLVMETLQLSGRLITESLPYESQSARRSPLLPSVVPQLHQCSHLLLTLLADVGASSIRELQAMCAEAEKLKTMLLESRVLNVGGEGY